MGDARDVRRVIAPALGGLVALAHAVAAAGAGSAPRRPVTAMAGLGGRPAFLPATADDAAVGPFPWSGAGSALPATEDPHQLRLIALVDLARGGDAEAFGELYDHYVGAVYRYVYYRVGSHTLAEDLTSETFLRALRAIGGFRWQGRDIGAWFTTIARNLITDHVKSSRFRLEVSTADLLDADRADGGLEDAVLLRLDAARLLDAVRQLTSEQQECVTLRFLQGLSVAETADVMGRREGAVKQLQLRAVRTLARLLADGTEPS